MVKWICYPSGDKPDMWTKWHSSQNGAVKGKHATTMRFLAEGHWKGPHYKLLQGETLKGLGEICIHGDVEWRLIGFRNIKENTFTICVICNHKNRVYKPKEAFDMAVRRRKEMLNGLPGVLLDAYPK